MIVETCKKWDQVEGLVGIRTSLLVICGTCKKRKECHAEIRAKKAKGGKG